MNLNPRIHRADGLIRPQGQGQWLLFLIAAVLALGNFTVQLGGQLLISEGLCLVIAIFLPFSQYGFLSNLPFIKKISYSFGFAVLVYFLSDLINGSDTINLLKGFSRWVFLYSLVIVLTYAFNKNHSASVVIGISISIGLMLLAYVNSLEEGWRWKFSLAEPVTLLVLCSVAFLKRPLGVFLCIAIGLVNFYLDYRSQAGACLVAGFMYLISGGGVSGRKLLGFGLLFAIFGGGSYLAFQEVYDSNESKLTRARLSGLEFGVKAISMSPLIGYGTWASNREILAIYTSIRQEARIDQGSRLIGDEDAADSIVGAIHSQVLQVAAEAGIFSTIPFIVMLYCLYRSLVVCLVADIKLSHRDVVCVYLVTLALWSILFSPFAGSNRLVTALGVASAIRLIVIYFNLQKPLRITKGWIK